MTEPWSIFEIVEDKPLFVYHQVTFDNQTQQTPWSSATFPNIAGHEVADTPEIILGKDFCNSIWFDFAHEQRDRLHGIKHVSVFHAISCAW